MTEAEIAWIAGIVEGEGSINLSIPAGRDNKYPTLRVQMTDGDIVERVYKLSGVGTFYGPSDRGFTEKGVLRKPVWLWQVSARDDTRFILESIRPWLGLRRGQKADEAIGRLSEPFKKGPEANPCGTLGAAIRHRKKGELECDACVDARRSYSREWEQKNRIQKRAGIRRAEGRRQISSLDFFGETKNITEWSRDYRAKVSAQTIARRIQNGWSAEEAITTASKNNHRTLSGEVDD